MENQTEKCWINVNYRKRLSLGDFLAFFPHRINHHMIEVQLFKLCDSTAVSEASSVSLNMKIKPYTRFIYLFIFAKLQFKHSDSTLVTRSDWWMISDAVWDVVSLCNVISHAWLVIHPWRRQTSINLLALLAMLRKSCQLYYFLWNF